MDRLIWFIWFLSKASNRRRSDAAIHTGPQIGEPFRPEFLAAKSPKWWRLRWFKRVYQIGPKFYEPFFYFPPLLWRHSWFDWTMDYSVAEILELCGSYPECKHIVIFSQPPCFVDVICAFPLHNQEISNYLVKECLSAKCGKDSWIGKWKVWLEGNRRLELDIIRNRVGCL